jgi:hypothetical protein
MLPYVQENYERSVKYAKFRETLRDEVIEFVKNYGNCINKIDRWIREHDVSNRNLL